MGFLNRFKSDSTKGIFLIFTLIFIIASFLFFLFLNYDQENKSEKLIEISLLKEEVVTLKNELELEAQHSLNSSLLFNVSGKEIDRFQTIYSLKSTKELYVKFKGISRQFFEPTEIEKSYETLRQFLSNYDQKIAESINKDGRLAELLQTAMQQNDSIQTTLLIDEGDIGIALAISSRR